MYAHTQIQVAKALGAKVTAVCSERNKKLVQDLGADHVVDYTKGHDGLVEQVCIHANICTRLCAICFRQYG
jgi:NADPH:quinone reductase-like Zn-dependent oxidoreductase